MPASILEPGGGSLYLVPVLIAVMFALVLLNYRVDRSVLYPPFILCFMWLLVFGIYQTHLIEIDPIHWPTALLVSGGMCLFSLGGLVAMLLPKVLFSRHLGLGPLSHKPRRETWLHFLMLAVIFIGTLLVVHSTFVVSAIGTGGNVLARARDAGVAAQLSGDPDGGSSNPLVIYTPVWSVLLAIIFLLERRTRLFWAMASLSFIASLFTTGRGPVILLFCSLMAAYLLRENRVRIGAAVRMIRIPATVGFVLYVVLIFTNKNVSDISGGVLGVILFFVGGYFISPVVALDYVLQNPQEYTNDPNHTFKFFLGAAAKLHLLNYQPPPMLDKFLNVPFPTNVYTGFKFYYTDFGAAGCLLIVALIGFLHAALYRKARTGTELAVFLYSATVFPAVMFIFSDLYSAFGEDLDIVAVGILYFATRSLLARPEPVARLVPLRLPRFRLLPASAVPRLRLIGSPTSRQRHSWR